MAVETLKAGTLQLPATIVTQMFSKVKGHSSIAKLVGQTPIAFNGNEYFTFSMDDEVNLVGEGAVKATGKMAIEPITVKPLKVEYGLRVTDEFMYATEEKQLDILTQFTDGYSKKVARGLDIMAFHGVNPRDKAASELIGTNSFDTNTSISKVTYAEGSEEDSLDDAAAALGDYDMTGIILSKAYATALSKITVNGVRQYPEFRFGANPGSLNGMPCDVNSTVTFTGDDMAIVGDFTDAFKWGYAKEIPVEVIPYGDPDQSGVDLKAHNQVYLRAETYIGWGILDPAAFARIVKAAA